MRGRLERWLSARWYGRPGVLLLFVPLEFLYRLVVALRYVLRNRVVPSVPLIVVGNITVGGSGKTPLVLWLVERLGARGLRVGIVSRGYGGSGPFPLHVEAETPAAACGDEPALLARRTGALTVVDPDRRRALAMLLGKGVDVVVSDDGLQHLALPRTVEIAVVDGRRGFGNGHCLPVGPLREPVSRLEVIDLLVVNGSGGWPVPHGAIVMTLLPTVFRKVGATDECLAPDAFRARFGARVAAVAGMGDPARFFTTLRTLGFIADEFPFQDHHSFSPDDFSALAGVVVMTEKDAVKCAGIAGIDAWYLEIEAQLPAAFLPQLLRCANLDSEGRA